jgi:hypothetical protein
MIRILKVVFFITSLYVVNSYAQRNCELTYEAGKYVCFCDGVVVSMLSDTTYPDKVENFKKGCVASNNAINYKSKLFTSLGRKLTSCQSPVLVLDNPQRLHFIFSSYE